MSLSDCEKCWDSLCTCGWSWRHHSLADLERFHRIISTAIEFKRAHPDAAFSADGKPETADDRAFMEAVRNAL